MKALYQFLLRQGDTALVLGHRLSEWCGRGPTIEEDIALANTALDLIGQARLWLDEAAKAAGADQSADDLAYLRDAMDFRNLLLVERPNGDFARTMMRQYIFDAFHAHWLTALAQSTHEPVADIAAKSAMEARYHLERSRQIVITLGDSTDEAHRRIQAALDALWPYAGEVFQTDEIDEEMARTGVAPLPSGIRPEWEAELDHTFAAARLKRPESPFAHQGGRSGRMHSEHLGHMLATMQYLQRAHPGAAW